MAKQAVITFELDGSRLRIRAESPHPAILELDRGSESIERINQLSESYRGLIARRSFAENDDTSVLLEVRRFGAEVYDLFFSGLEAALVSSTSLLLRHNTFFFPLELAHDGKEFLGFRYAIGNWLPKLQEEFPEQADKEVRSSKSAAESIELPLGQSPRLRVFLLGLEEEPLSQVFQKTRDVRCDALTTATIDKLYWQLKWHNYDVFHFSGHGWLNEDKPQESYLVLDERGLQRESILRCNQLVRGHFHTPLVFLNTCHSGRVGAGYRGFVDFATSFLQAGATGCIATLWSIDNRGAARFAAAFYEGLLHRLTVGEALRQARLACWVQPETLLTSLSYVLFGRPNSRIGEAGERGVAEQQEESPNPIDGADA